MENMTRNVAEERNSDIRDDHIHGGSFLDSPQLIYVDKSGCDRSISNKNNGWDKKFVTPVQMKRINCCSRLRILRIAAT